MTRLEPGITWERAGPREHRVTVRREAEWIVDQGDPVHGLWALLGMQNHMFGGPICVPCCGLMLNSQYPLAGSAPCCEQPRYDPYQAAWFPGLLWSCF